MAESKSKEELIRTIRDVPWSQNFIPEGNLTFTTLFSQQEHRNQKPIELVLDFKMTNHSKEPFLLGWSRWGEATGYRLASGTGPSVEISLYFIGVIELMDILALALGWLLKLQLCPGVFMLHMHHSRSATSWNSVARCEGERGWMSFHIFWSSRFSLTWHGRVNWNAWLAIEP